MRIEKIINKKYGVTYIYEVEDVYDPEKKRTVAKRKCIGKLDPKTNELVPMGKRGRPRKQTDDPQQTDTAPAPAEAPVAERTGDTGTDPEAELAALQAEMARLQAETDRLQKVLDQIFGAVSDFRREMEEVLPDGEKP